METHVSVIFLWFALFVHGINSKYGVHTTCDGTDKHCIECLQLEMDWGRHFAVPNQRFFRHLLQNAVNQYRSKYAEQFNLGNMRYAEWNKIFYKFCHELSITVGDTKFYCVTGGKSLQIPTRFDHEMIDFSSNVDFIVPSNNTSIIEEQFNILLNKILAVIHITEYNMDEFGCVYSFQPQRDSTAFLLRCIFYTNPDYAAEGEIYSNVNCSNCSTSQLCSIEYPRLCIN